MNWLRRSLAYWPRIGLGLLVASAFGLGLHLLRPGLFTVDESSYLLLARAVAERGAFSIETGFDSPELETPWTVLHQDRLTSAYPPLYGVFAAPFYRTWRLRGLIFLNLASFCALLLVLYRLARRTLEDEGLALFCAILYATSTFAFEYTLGVWPHMLLTLLLAVCLDLLSGEILTPALAGAAGLGIGLATGVRLQAILTGAWLALFLLAFAPRRRLQLTGAFLLGLAGPLALIAAINEARFGVFSPFSYGLEHQQSHSTGQMLQPLLLLASSLRHADWGGFRYLLLEFAQHLYGEWIDVGNGTTRAMLASMPFLTWALAAFPALRPGREGRPRLPILLWGSCLVLIGFYAVDHFWYGGFTLNLRYFNDFLPAAVILCVLGWRNASQGRPRWGFLLLAAGAGLLLPLAWLPPLALAAASMAIALLARLRPGWTWPRLGALLFGLALALAARACWTDLRQSLGMRRWTMEQTLAVQKHVAPNALLLTQEATSWHISALQSLQGAWIADVMQDHRRSLPDLIDRGLARKLPVYLVSLQEPGWEWFIRRQIEPRYRLKDIHRERSQWIVRVLRARLHAFRPPLEIRPGLDAYEPYLISGFQDAEFGGRWTAAEAKLWLPVPARDSGLRLRLRTLGQRPDGKPACVSVSLEGVPIGEFTEEARPQTLDWPIPDALVLQPEGSAVLRLRADLFQPAKKPMGVQGARLPGGPGQRPDKAAPNPTLRSTSGAEHGILLQSAEIH